MQIGQIVQIERSGAGRVTEQPVSSPTPHGSMGMSREMNKEQGSSDQQVKGSKRVSTLTAQKCHSFPSLRLLTSRKKRPLEQSERSEQWEQWKRLLLASARGDRAV